MKSKLAVWSLILAIVPFALFILHFLVLGPLDILRGETSSSLIFVVVLIFFAPFLGFILGIIALFKINKNPGLEGKWFAIVAIAIIIISLIVLVLS